MRGVFCLSAFLVALLVAAHPSNAQIRNFPTSDPATGERYYVEGAIGLWNPSPSITVASEALGILGTQIDAVNDLGITKTRFPEFRLVLRPAKKHKFRFSYVPISYTAETLLRRDIVFNGIRYRIGLPVNSSLDWKAYRFGYEFDFLSRDRWFVGAVVEAKYTDVSVNLASPVDTEFARAAAPIPALGGIARVYPVANISVTGELTAFRLPEGIDQRYRGKYVDFDLYGTVNFTNNFGAQVGYRSIHVNYVVKSDNGDLTLNGLYFMGVARF